MANFLSTKIALRTDTIQNWNSLSNQILLNGEVAIVMTDEKLPLFKIGDGVHKFYELPYSNSKISSDMVNAIDIIAKSICQGANSSAVPQSLAAGLMVSSDVPYSQAFGYNTKTKSGDIYSFTWSGEAGRDINSPYSSHAIGSFNINPNNGLSGFYVGDRNLKEVIEGETSDFSKVTLISNDVAYSKDLSVVKIAGEEYYKLVAGGKANLSALYVVDDPYLNAYGQTIKNVALPELSNDAATKNYVDSEIAKIPAPDFSEYYKKTETSSNAEIETALDSKVDTVEVNQLSDALSTAISTDIKNLADNYAKKTDIKVEYVRNDKKIYLSAGDYVTSVDANDFIKDGMISTVTYDETTHMLCIVWNADAGSKTTTINLSGLIDTYAAGYGLSLANGEFSVDTEEIAQKSDLDNYYLTSETSSATEISQAISDFVKVSVDNMPIKDFKMLHISYEEYVQLVNDENIDPHTIYVLSADGCDDQFGNRIINLGSPISADDAATKNYVDSEIAKMPQPDLTQFYKKSETSSSAEIADAIKSNVQVSAALGSGTQIASISVDGVATPIYAPDGGAAEWGSIDGNVEDQRDLIKVNYPLDNPTASSETVDGVAYKRFDIKDHTIATISLSDETPVRIHFPDKPTENFCRDFIVKIKVTSVNIPQVQFVKGQNDTSIGFEYEDDVWATLEVGINYFTFTETERE